MSVSFLEREGAPPLAYALRPGIAVDAPTVMFLPGFCSDMAGTKAVFLDDLCAKEGYACLRFDYSGHGASGGAFRDGSIGVWLQDALDIFERLTQGPVIVVGSSMGGWIGLLMCLQRPERIAAFVGLAAAPDFTREIPDEMSDEQKAQMQRDGFFPLPHEYGGDPYVITRNLLEEGEKHCLLDGAIDIRCPVRLIQGMKDADVPWQKAHRIVNAMTGTDKKVYLREEGDHRLSTPEDLDLLGKIVRDLARG